MNIRFASKAYLLALLAAVGSMSGCGKKRISAVPIEPEMSTQTRTSLTVETDPVCVARLDLQSTGPSLVFNEPDLLRDAFSLRSTLGQLVATSGSEGTPTTMLDSALATYESTEETNPISQLDVPVDLRTAEARLDADTLLNAMFPVAVFNRIDLRSAANNDCGEYRIIYARPRQRGPRGGSRLLFIFEARYPNPTPQLGEAGCQPIAEFWGQLSSPALSDAQRVERLQAFFYRGIVVGGTALPPVLHFDHFRGDLGQLRTNNFIMQGANGRPKWQLRELRTAIVDGGPGLVADTVKGTPIAELFGGNFQGADRAGFAALRAEFQEDFIVNQLAQLLKPELEGAVGDIDLVNGLTHTIDPGFFDFQSDSDGTLDDPTASAGRPGSNGLLAEINAAIPEVLGTENSGITGEMILNRMGAMTCGGCHRYSAGRPIAPGVTWPNDLNFVHVDEAGNLSEALTEMFLPTRRALLEGMLCPPVEEEPEEPAVPEEVDTPDESGVTPAPGSDGAEPPVRRPRPERPGAGPEPVGGQPGEGLDAPEGDDAVDGDDGDDTVEEDEGDEPPPPPRRPGRRRGRG